MQDENNAVVPSASNELLARALCEHFYRGHHGKKPTDAEEQELLRRVHVDVEKHWRVFLQDAEVLLSRICEAV